MTTKSSDEIMEERIARYINSLDFRCTCPMSEEDVDPFDAWILNYIKNEDDMLKATRERMEEQTTRLSERARRDIHRRTHMLHREINTYNGHQHQIINVMARCSDPEVMKNIDETDIRMVSERVLEGQTPGMAGFEQTAIFQDGEVVGTAPHGHACMTCSNHHNTYVPWPCPQYLDMIMVFHVEEDFIHDEFAAMQEAALRASLDPSIGNSTVAITSIGPVIG